MLCCTIAAGQSKDIPVSTKAGFWKTRKYHLDKMTLGELFKAYFQYYAIQIYIVVGAVCTYLALSGNAPLTGLFGAAAAAILSFPFFWYLIHRYILHGTWLARSPYTSALWKRIHFDHHQDPHDLYILFGAVYTTLPSIALATIPMGYWIAGWYGAAASMAAGSLTYCFYEFCHCFEHLSYKPKYKILQRMKQLHLGHHFHSEQGNYGITNFMWDHIFGTYYHNKKRPPKSATVFNLGYDQDMADKFPWVAELSGGVSNDSPRERRKQFED